MAALRSRLELWAQVTGLLATAWIVWASSLAPYLSGTNRRLAPLIARALFIAFCALGWSAAIGLALQLVTGRLNRVEIFPERMRASGVAVWFAPATMLLLQFSPLGFAAGLALIVNAARLLSAPSPSMDSTRNFMPALVISTGFQAATVSLLMGHPVLAAMLLAMSTAMFTSVAIGLGAWVEHRPPNLPRSVMGLGLTVLLALMVGRVTRGVGWGWDLGWGPEWGSSEGGAKIVTLVGPASEAAGSEGSKQREKGPDKIPAPETNAPGDYPGVILWPEIRPVTVLIAPPAAKGGAFAAPSRPLTIPFGGEYWMYRWPYLRPPRNSYFQRGTPVAMFFSTTDRRPLQMEARQKLAQAISLRCCSRMQVAILNADLHPRTISLEVVLMDGERPNGAPQSLGIATVTSVPGLKTDRTARPVAETLDFPFPTSPHLDQFDEIKVIFHKGGRTDKSSRVSIERFVLVPVG